MTNFLRSSLVATLRDYLAEGKLEVDAQVLRYVPVARVIRERSAHVVSQIHSSLYSVTLRRVAQP